MVFAVYTGNLDNAKVWVGQSESEALVLGSFYKVFGNILSRARYFSAGS